MTIMAVLVMQMASSAGSNCSSSEEVRAGQAEKCRVIQARDNTAAEYT